MDNPITTKATGAAQAAYPCGMDCDEMAVCAKRRVAFESYGVCGHQSDGLSADACEALVGMFQQAYEAGYLAGQRDVLAQSRTRWAT